jgi:hypothetical protein
MKTLAAVMTSVLGNALGQLGQGIQLFFFPATAPNGSTIAAASKQGKFSVMLAGHSFEWRLPLSSLLPQKVCPVDGEKMSGAWKYCPWHGNELTDSVAPASAAKP